MTIEYQVVQFVPSINISDQFESILVTILQQISFFFIEVVVIDAWSRYFVELCRIVGLLTISLHTFLCMTLLLIRPWKIRKFWVVNSPLSPRKVEIQTWFCNCPQYLCLFGIVVERIQSFHDPWKMLVLPKSTSSLSTFHIGSRFCFFPANFMSSTYTHEKNPFSWFTKKHSQFGIFSQPCFKKIFSNCLSHDSPAKVWPYRFLSRGTTGSSIQDHDLGHFCVVVDETKCLDTPIWEISIILSTSSILTKV